MSLDGFQEAALKTFLDENHKEREYILSLELAENDKIDKLTTSYEKMETQINTVLNAKQKEDFLKIKNKKKGKDKKKRNKKDTTDEVENE